MTFSFRASSRMTSKFIYSSYFDSPDFFLKSIYSSYSNSSAFFIFNKSSSSSNSSKFVFFAYIMFYLINKSISSSIEFEFLLEACAASFPYIDQVQKNHRRLLLHLLLKQLFNFHLDIMSNHWFQNHHHTSENMISAEFKFSHITHEKTLKSVIHCEDCDRIVFVDKWINLTIDSSTIRQFIFFQMHQQLESQCVFVNRQRIQSARFVEKSRLLDELKVRLAKKRAKQQIEKTRLVKKHAKQQQIEQTRIAKKQKEVRLTTFACRRCSAKFSSNIKFHIHVQNHHQKFTKSANEIAKSTSNEPAISTSIAISASITFSATFSSTSESALLLTSSVSHSESISKFSFSNTLSATSIATSKKIFWIEIVSRSVIASKFSRFPVSTSKIKSKTLKIAAISCSPISPSSFSQKSTSKHQKSYFIIEDLFEMFAEKRTKSDQSHIRKIEFFSRVFRQFKITFYFRSAINQSKSITQNSKTSNSRSFQQHTSAESNRIKFILSKWSEKSINLFYKTSTFFCLRISEISNISPYKMPSISRFQSMVAFCKLMIRLSVSIQVFSSFFHVCRICCDTFESNNDLHRHLRAIHFDHASRHEFEKHRALERNVMTRRFLTLWWRNGPVFLLFSCITNRFLMDGSHVLVTRHNENVVIFFRWWHLLR